MEDRWAGVIHTLLLRVGEDLAAPLVDALGRHDGCCGGCRCARQQQRTIQDWRSGLPNGWNAVEIGVLSVPFKHARRAQWACGPIGLGWASSKIPSYPWLGSPRAPASPPHRPRQDKTTPTILSSNYSEPMFPTRVLFTPGVRLTLFTRAGCSLCDTAKNNVLNVLKRRPLDYSEIDVMAPGNKVWKDVYEFDVPVLHVQTVKERQGGAAEEISEPKKLFHRFTEQEVEKLVDEAEQ